METSVVRTYHDNGSLKEEYFILNGKNREYINLIARMDHYTVK